jgi:hypothetical protein
MKKTPVLSTIQHDLSLSFILRLINIFYVTFFIFLENTHHQTFAILIFCSFTEE